MKKFVHLAGVFLIFLLLVPLVLMAAPLSLGNDVDGDGISDMIMITVKESGDLKWRVYSGVTNKVLFRREALGRIGDHIAIAKWLTAGHASLAYLSMPAQRVTWNVLDELGSLKRKTFGKAGELLISGGDYDGNGVADAALIRTSADLSYTWYVKPNFFAGGLKTVNAKMLARLGLRRSASVLRLRFGKSPDMAFYFDPNGHGDWLGVLRKIGSGYRLLRKNVFSKRTRKTDLGFLSKGILRPLALKQESGGDVLAFARRKDGNTDVWFVSTKGELVSQAEFAGTGELLVGNFIDAPGAELAIQGAKEFTVYNPLTQETSTKNWGLGIAVDDININSFKEPSSPGSPTPSPTPGEDVPPEDNPPPPGGNLAAVCPHMHPMDRSVLYKPASGGTNDSRTGRPAFLWYEWENNPHVMKLYVLASNGKQIAVMGHYNVGRPYVRFYSGFSPGTGETAAQLANKARAVSGKAVIYFYTKNGNCWGGCPNPLERCGGR